MGNPRYEAGWQRNFPKILKMTYDPLTFFHDPYFLDWKLRPAQVKIITEFFGGPHKEMIGCAGMRGGKTTVMAGCCLYDLAQLLAMEDPFKHYGLLRVQPISLIGMSFRLITDLSSIRQQYSQ